MGGTNKRNGKRVIELCNVENFFNNIRSAFTLTRNTTPAKPREGRFGSIWFVCDLKFQG